MAYKIFLVFHLLVNWCTYIVYKNHIKPFRKKCYMVFINIHIVAELYLNKNSEYLITMYVYAEVLSNFFWGFVWRHAEVLCLKLLQKFDDRSLTSRRMSNANSYIDTLKVIVWVLARGLLFYQTTMKLFWNINIMFQNSMTLGKSHE